MQENYTKISKIKQLEVIGARRATMGHLVGLADPTFHRPTWHLRCHLTSPWEVAKKHTSKPSSPLIPSRFKMKGQKEASHGLLTHHVVCRYSNGQIVFIPTLYNTAGATTPKEEGPLHSGMPADAKGCRSEPHFHSTASPSDTCKETHLRAILCVDLRWFKVGLI
jgi:hypothetical protein